MSTGREFSSYQRKVINRYYDNLDTIVVTRLGEIVTDMALAGGDEKKLARLWKRAEQALERVKGESNEVSQIIDQRDVEALARFVTKVSKR
tara:strand:- start:54462 stop:54734 length:273 start_codon:yes stop_codon:yes gene_type:complete